MPKLTVIKVKSITSPGRYGDGEGLYLNIASSGSKSWVQRITINDRRHDIGLGGYPTVPLAQSRRRAAENCTAVADGRDPIADKRRAAIPTFFEAATEFHTINLSRWRNAHHAKTWMGMFERHVLPHIGNMPVDQIGREDVLALLKPLWTTKPETRASSKTTSSSRIPMVHGLWFHRAQSGGRGNRWRASANAPGEESLSLITVPGLHGGA